MRTLNEKAWDGVAERFEASATRFARKEAELRDKIVSAGPRLVPYSTLGHTTIPTIGSMARVGKPLIMASGPTPLFLAAEEHLYAAGRSLSRARKAAEAAHGLKKSVREQIHAVDGTAEGLITAFESDFVRTSPERGVTGVDQTFELLLFMDIFGGGCSRAFLDYAAAQAESVKAFMESRGATTQLSAVDELLRKTAPART